MSDKILTDTGTNRLSYNAKRYINKRVATLTQSEYDALPLITKMNGTMYLIEDDPAPDIVPFATATDAELADIINAYYDGTITLADIQEVWSIGDTRTINLSAIPATGIFESHRAQTIDIQILDFDHDTLTTPINGITKALITVDQKNCLRDANVSDTNGEDNTENGFMNNTRDKTANLGGWKTSPRKTWLNDSYYNALPNYLSSLIKPADKLTAIDCVWNDREYVSSKIFFLSEEEMYGYHTRSGGAEGSVYELYKTAANRYKKPNWDSSKPSNKFLLRSTSSDTKSGSSYYYLYFGGSGYADMTFGLAPAFCL